MNFKNLMLMKRIERYLPLISIVEFFIILALGTFIGKFYLDMIEAGKKEYKLPTITVEAKPVELGDFESFITVMGALKANESVIIRPQEPGVIKALYFKDGSYVKKGDLLMQLDDSILQAKLLESKARLNLTKIEFDRVDNLLKKGASARSKWDEGVAKHQMAQAEMKLIEAQIDHLALRAPFDGIVGLRDVSVGAFVKGGEDIVTLDDIDTVDVDFRLNEHQLAKIKIGQEVDVTVDGFSHNAYQAVVESIDPVSDLVSHSIRVRASIKNKDHDLKPGLFARVRIKENTHDNAMLLPESAVESEGAQEYVYVVLNGKAHRAPIKVGGRNGKLVEVLSGLRAGLMVVTSGQLRLGEGYPVTVVPEKSKLGYK